MNKRKFKRKKKYIYIIEKLHTKVYKSMDYQKINEFIYELNLNVYIKY